MTKKLICVVAIVFALICVFASCSNDGDDSGFTCSSCGEAISDNTTPCPHCGNTVTDSTHTTESSNDDTTETIIVNSPKELLEAIGDDRKIVLNGGVYNLSDIENIENPKVERVDLTKQAVVGLSIMFQEAYVISHVRNLEIVGEGTLVIEGGGELGAVALCFQNCEQITISNVDFSTTDNSEEDRLQLLSLTGCENVIINSCTFESCDITLLASHNVNIKNSQINEFNCIHLDEESNLKIVDSKISNFVSAFVSTEHSSASITNCEISGAKGVWPDYSYLAVIDSGNNHGVMAFENCVITNNKVEAMTAHGDWMDEYREESCECILFNNCTITNNVYCHGNLESSQYTDCSFSDNKLGVFVPNCLTWDQYIAERSLSECGVDYIIKDTNYADMHLGDPLSMPIGVVAQSASGVIPQGEQVTLYTSIPLASIYSIGCNLNSEGVLVLDIEVFACMKTIAYIDVTLTFDDETFEPIYDNNGDIYEQSFKISGPLEVDKDHSGHWEFVVSDPEIYAFHIDKMEIVCTDGTKQVITFAWGSFWCINKSSD